MEGTEVKVASTRASLRQYSLEGCWKSLSAVFKFTDFGANSLIACLHIFFTYAGNAGKVT
jgi:hypothetical protein